MGKEREGRAEKFQSLVETFILPSYNLAFSTETVKWSEALDEQSLSSWL